MAAPETAPKSPAWWVPTLFFAEGLPFFAVNMLALAYFAKMGVSNTVTTLVVSLLAWPWSLKPLWSPLLEMYRTKKYFVVLFQFMAGVSLVLLALSLSTPDWFRYMVALLAVIGFCSATHDIAADGLYIASLAPKQQAAWSGVLGACYNAARFFSQGALMWLIGFLGEHFAKGHVAMPVVKAWMIVFGGLGLLMVGMALWHAHVLPTGGEERRTQGLGEAASTFWDVVVTFFQKPRIGLLLLFIFLFRAGEGQVMKVGPLFLLADRAKGGLGLTEQGFGLHYGGVGSACFIAGSLAGGLFASRLGLKRALPWLILILNLPFLAYWYLSVALPTNTGIIATAIGVEMFGYGFGFVGVTLLMMQEVAPGKYQTAHYAFANALMNLGMMLPGSVSGYLQSKVGYSLFFILAVLAAIPAFAMCRYLPLRGGEAAQDEPTQA